MRGPIPARAMLLHNAGGHYASSSFSSSRSFKVSDPVWRRRWARRRVPYRSASSLAADSHHVADSGTASELSLGSGSSGKAAAGPGERLVRHIVSILSLMWQIFALSIILPPLVISITYSFATVTADLILVLVLSG